MIHTDKRSSWSILHALRYFERERTMTTLTIGLKELEHNTALVKQLAGDSCVYAVLKGNGYGLGLLEFADFLQNHSINHFAVTDLSDAVALRTHGICGEILMLTPLHLIDDLQTAIKNDITLCITSCKSGMAAETAALYSAHNQTTLQSSHPHQIKAHLCIDTGFGRFGFLPSEIPDIIEMVNNMHSITFTGIFSHLHNPSSKDSSSSEKQLQDFLHVCDELEKNDIQTGIRHISSTSALIRFPHMRLDAVRVGSAFLGRIAVKNNLDFIKIGRLSTTIEDIYELPSGHNIGYGHYFTTTKATKTAVVSVGYYHGLGMERNTNTKRYIPTIQNLAHTLKAYLRGGRTYAYGESARYPILGRISMNSCVIDITKKPLAIGDCVTFPICPLYVNSSIPRLYQ